MHQMHRECKQRTQNPAGWERDKTAESFPKTNFNILHCTTAPKEVTHAKMFLFFSSKQKTFLDHCCCNLFSAFESMQLMEFWRLRLRVLFAQAALFANSKLGWLSISHHCYTPQRAKMFEKSEKGEIGYKNAFNSHGRMSANRKYERYHVNFSAAFCLNFWQGTKIFLDQFGVSGCADE